MVVHRRGRGGAPPPPPQTYVTISGNNEICNRENLVSHFQIFGT